MSSAGATASGWNMSRIDRAGPRPARCAALHPPYGSLTPTPGHTPDHFAVCAGKGGDRAVFTGDLIHSPIQARYPELVMRVDTDRDQAVQTRRRFFERYCDTDTLCCTMPFPSPSVGHVKRWGDGFRLEYVKD